MGPRETSTRGLATATLTAPAAVDAWRTRLRDAVYALYRRLDDHSAPPVEAEIEGLVDLIDEGRLEPASPATLTRVTAEALGGAICHELFLAAREEVRPPASELVPTLMYSAVLPYAGLAGAADELRAPAPPR
jgi:hypothetical protein